MVIISEPGMEQFASYGVATIYEVSELLPAEKLAYNYGGVNFFNTADAYANGQSEIMLGKALGKRRQEVVIATKVGNRMSEALIDQGLSRQHIIASVQASLKRLNTDYIDVYLVHRLDPYTPIEETLFRLKPGLPCSRRATLWGP